MAFIPFTTEEQKRFDELAALLEGCRATFYAKSLDSMWTAAPGSVAEADKTFLVAGPLKLSSQHAASISGLAHDFLYMAAEHLASLGALYRYGRVILAPGALARCAVESCAHVMWLLGNPGDPSEQRFKRACLEAVANAREAKRQSGRLVGSDSSDHRSWTERTRELEAEAEHWFGPITSTKRGCLMLNDQERPGPTDMVVRMNELMSHGLSETIARGFYGFLSNFVHPMPYVMREQFKESQADGQTVLKLREDHMQFHDRLAQSATVPFYVAVASTANYQGWAHPEIDRLADEVNRALPNSILPSKAE